MDRVPFFGQWTLGTFFSCSSICGICAHLWLFLSFSCVEICYLKKVLLYFGFKVLAFCSISYFVMIFILQVYQWYVEKLTFYQAMEPSKDGKSPSSYWKWSSDMKRFFYLLLNNLEPFVALLKIRFLRYFSGFFL